MHKTYMRRISAVAVAVLTVGLTIGAVGTLSASAKKAPKPKLSVSVTKALVNDQVVSVSGSNMTPKDQIYVLECVIGETSTSGSGCNLNNLVGPETVTSGGTIGPVNFTVKTGPIGTQGGTCGTSKKDFKKCDISAGDEAGGDAVAVKIQFVK
jgi:hypothetical protein